MKTKTINLYSFNELSDEAKERAINDNRYINVDFEWWEFVFEDWREKLENIGFENADIHFSGFYSQGDGACFDAYCNMKKLYESVKHIKNVQRIKECFGNDLTGGIKKVGLWNLYSHENTRDFCIDFFTGNRTPRINKLINQAESIIEDLRKDLSQQIYSDLSNEYDYLTSYEVIAETLKANDYEFLENGERA